MRKIQERFDKEGIKLAAIPIGMEIEGRLDRQGVPVWFEDRDNTDLPEIDRDSTSIKPSYILDKENGGDRPHGVQSLDKENSGDRPHGSQTLSSETLGRETTLN